MGRHEVYYQPRAVPCPCGSMSAYWHGPSSGMRVYCCDGCWQAMPHSGREWLDEAEQRALAVPLLTGGADAE